MKILPVPPSERSDIVEHSTVGSKHRGRSFYLAALGLIAVGALGGPVTAQEKRGKTELEAAFLFKFLSFVDWPDQGNDRFVIGVVDSPSIAAELSPIKGKMVNGRMVMVRELTGEVAAASLIDCHILFIPSSGSNRARSLLSGLEGLPVLTVSRGKSMSAQVMINFVTWKNRLRFELNRDLVNGSGLRLRASLQRVALRTIGGEGGQR